jgi:hypothetical protein
MYKIEIVPTKNLFIVTMSGFMKEDESKAYLDEFRRKLRTITPSNFNIVVDTHELITASKNLTDLMKEAQELIVRTPFKKRYSIMPKSIIATSQIKRVGKDDEVFKNTTFAESYEDVLKQLN